MHASAIHNSIVWHQAELRNLAGSWSRSCSRLALKTHCHSHLKGTRKWDMLEGGSWEIFFSSPLTMTSLDHVKEKKKKKKERSANWLANSPQTNGQLMTLVAAAAQGLLMKPPDQSLLFKTWKLTDHWTGILGLQATVNLLCETNSAPKPSCCQDTLTHTLTICARSTP